jgi:hypothetical protein
MSDDECYCQGQSEIYVRKQHLLDAHAAIRYLWNAWADAEGKGQPEVAVFGDAEMDAYLKAQDEVVPERASPEVQAVIRELLSTPHPS